MNTNRNQKIVSGIATVALAGVLWGVASTQAQAQSKAAKAVKQNAVRNSGFNTHRVNPTNKRVSMELQDASVRQALIQLFRKSGADFTLDNSVAGNVTLRLTNEPFDRALAMILRGSSAPLTVDVDSGTYVIKPAGVVTSVKPSARPMQVATLDMPAASETANNASNSAYILGDNTAFVPEANVAVGNTAFVPGGFGGGAYTSGNTTFLPGYGGYGFGDPYSNSGGALVPNGAGYTFNGPGFYNPSNGIGYTPGTGVFSSGLGGSVYSGGFYSGGGGVYYGNTVFGF